jgi:hypothetical protein
MPAEKIINRAVAGLVADLLLIGPLEIVNVQHLTGAGGFGEARQQRFLFRDRHVLAQAAAARLRLERFDAALVVRHMRAVHRAERNAHRLGNGRLCQSLFTQQHHLDALALRFRNFPT